MISPVVLNVTVCPSRTVMPVGVHACRADTVIPYRMTEELYKAKPGVKLLLTLDGVHGLIDIKGGGSIVENREAFERKVDELLALAAKGGGSRRHAP